MSKLSIFSNIHKGGFAVFFFACAITLNGIKVSAQVLSTNITLSAFGSDHAQYLKGGIPFPIGVLNSTENLRLLSGGNEVPAQFDKLSSWPDGSIKSVLVSLVTVPNNSKTYALEYGSGVDRNNYSSDLQVNDSASSIQVTTGPLRFSVNKDAFNIIEGVWKDGNGDGSFTGVEKVLSQGEIFLVNAFDDKTYTASSGVIKSVFVEESGPMRVVIRAEGSLRSSDDEILTDYIVRLYAYNGLEHIQLDYTLVDSRPETSVASSRSQLALSVASYGITFNHTIANADYVFGGDNGSSISGTVSNEHYLYQTGQMNYVNGSLDANNPFDISYSGVGSGGRAAGWVNLYNNGLGVTAIVQDFWQQFPNELLVDANQIKISLHPARETDSADLSYPSLSNTNNKYIRPNTFYFPREGGAKTYRIALDFPNGESGSARTNDINSFFQKHKPELLATAEWYASSHVFGDISPANSATSNYDNYLMNSVYVPSFKEGKNAVMYGWRDFGDRLYAGWNDVVDGTRVPGFYNDTHVGANNFYTQFLRTLDQRWWTLAEKSTYHFMDVDVSHSSRNGYHKTSGVTFTTPPGEVHAIKHSVVDHSSRNLHLGHAHVSGLTNMYLLTGDKRAYEVLMEVADFWEVMAPRLFPTPRPKTYSSKNRAYAEAERDFAWPLYVMNEIGRVDNNPSYHKNTAGQVVKHMMEWWQSPGEHIISGVNYGSNNASQGTGWWEMDNMDNGSGNGTNPWMAGALLSALIKYYEADLVYQNSAINHRDMKDMLYQTMNYVVSNGYNSSGKYFRYVEGKNTNGGSNHIVYSLAYLYRLLQNDINMSQVSHPEWYGTSAQWLTIATENYENYKNNALGEGTQSYGFYGYEMVYPIDYFSIMADLTGDAPSPSPTPNLAPMPPSNVSVEVKGDS